MSISEPPARGDAGDSALIDGHGHMSMSQSIPIENSSASGSHSASAESREEPPLASPTPSLNLEAAAPSSGDKDKEAGGGKAKAKAYNWLSYKTTGRDIRRRWPTTSRIARRIYRFFRGPSPPMPLPRTLSVCYFNPPI